MRYRSAISSPVLFCLLLGGCADTPIEGAAAYVVRPQDTLYSIAWRHDVDFRDLARWNHLGADLRISVGQVLALGPGGAPDSAPRASRSAMQSTARPLRTARPARLLRTSPAAAPGVALNATAKWVWPTDRAGVTRSTSGGGILFTGVLGQEVRAASAGRVVYLGNGLRGYGNLIIIKHGDALLSAYAHNSVMRIQEGQEVVAGQAIATMGEGPQQAPTLYFEIRQNGKPVNAMAFLPAVQ